MFWIRWRDPSVGFAIAQQVAFGVRGIVREVIEEVPRAHLVVLGQLVVDLHDHLIVVLSDRCAESGRGRRRRLAGGTQALSPTAGSNRPTGI